MRIRCLIVFVLPTLVLSPVSAVCGQGVTVDQPKLYSYQAPAGWTLQTLPSAQYPVACDTQDGRTKATISVEIDTAPGPLDAWTAQSLAKNKVQFSQYNIQIGDQKPFATGSGVNAIQVPITLTAGGNGIQFVDYFFAGSSDAKIAVTCSCPAADAAHYIPLFETAMKTFVSR